MNTTTYLLCGALFSAYFWIVTRRRRDPRTGTSVWVWLRNRIVLTIAIGLFWPGTATLIVAWQFPPLRRHIAWFIKGPPKEDR